MVRFAIRSITRTTFTNNASQHFCYLACVCLMQLVYYIKGFSVQEESNFLILFFFSFFKPGLSAYMKGYDVVSVTKSVSSDLF